MPVELVPTRTTEPPSWWRGYDPEEWAAAMRDATADLEGRAVLDIRAGTGAFAFAALDLGAAHVAAYEPDPRRFKLLAANLSRWPSRCQTVQAALVDELRRVEVDGFPVPVMLLSDVLTPGLVVRGD